MKKLETKDLTPALLQEVMKMTTPAEVVAFFQTKDYEVSEAGAQKILDYLNHKMVELEDDDLDNVSGGGSYGCGGGSTFV